MGSVLVAGLGNPEPQYARNRHNFGFHVLDDLGEKLKAEWSRKFDGEFGQGQVGETKVLLLKPLTFMNRSGDSVGPAARFFKLDPSALIVAHDELDLPLGRLQLKFGGGTGGHNGLRSIEGTLGTRDFGRLRLGIGRPPEGWDTADFVLSNFTADETAVVEAERKQAVAALVAAVEQGIRKAMNAHNRRS